MRAPRGLHLLEELREFLVAWPLLDAHEVAADFASGRTFPMLRRSPQVLPPVVPSRGVARISARGLSGPVPGRSPQSASHSSNKTSARTSSRTSPPYRNHPATSHHASRGRFRGLGKVRIVCSSRKENARS